MVEVKTLIDKWGETRKEKALAKILGVGPVQLSKWKHGTAPMPIEQYLRLVELLEEPDREAVVYAYVKAKAEKISGHFKKLLHLGKPRQQRFYAVV